ncbi:MAG: F0F1 ATP synthase subunit A, partial [Gammaproteobacteria bacterium]|nr:F0F1 ATP synthase subunit A [Gammaproteobacteria bacterium]
MEPSPFAPDLLFDIGPVPISRPVVTTWVIMAAMTAISWLGLRRASVRAGALQAALEIVVEALAKQVREIIRRDPWPYLPLLGTLFLFLAFANLSAVVPGAKPPTGRIETPAALAALVFLSVHVFGVRSRGLLEYLRRYVEPNPLLLPLNVLSEITRTFSLMVRLFGNVMSHELVIAIVSVIAGLLLPIPFLLLGAMIGLIQAFIFMV